MGKAVLAGEQIEKPALDQKPRRLAAMTSVFEWAHRIRESIGLESPIEIWVSGGC
jgi:hypothetical protein